MKMIDQIGRLTAEGEALTVPNMQALLLTRGIDPIGFNRHFLLDEIAKIIVSEMPSIQKRGWIQNPPYPEAKAA